MCLVYDKCEKQNERQRFKNGIKKNKENEEKEGRKIKKEKRKIRKKNCEEEKKVGRKNKKKVKPDGNAGDRQKLREIEDVVNQRKA